MISVDPGRFPAGKSGARLYIHTAQALSAACAENPHFAGIHCNP